MVSAVCALSAALFRSLCRLPMKGLTYVFLGFTDDKQYFVSFLYPIQTAQLPANLDAADPTELELFYADIDAYYG